jgi:hypothetical protein
MYRPRPLFIELKYDPFLLYHLNVNLLFIDLKKRLQSCGEQGMLRCSSDIVLILRGDSCICIFVLRIRFIRNGPRTCIQIYVQIYPVPICDSSQLQYRVQYVLLEFRDCYPVDSCTSFVRFYSFPCLFKVFLIADLIDQ